MWGTQWCNKSGIHANTGQVLDAKQGPEEASNALLRKVLVVDDEPDLAELAASLLGAHGLDVLVAHSGREALLVLESDHEVDAIFSDVRMPGMTGLELADAVKEMYPKVKIVLTSGYIQSEQLIGRERPYLFASKPYRIETILKLLCS
jgi:CheY-like chemotaxis protein